MREIKFRAWDKKEKKWLSFDEGDPIGNDGSLTESGYWTFIFDFDEDRVALMQYTGLKDKNGKEIYEGDIVNWTSWKIGFKHIDGSEVKLTPKVVQWVDGAWKLEEDSPWNLSIYDNVEVIGNIYENGDLLK